VLELRSPLALGPVELPNRIVSTAHQTTLVEEHLPTGDFVAYHEARARGGTGLIVLEAAAVHASGLLTAHTLGGYLPEIAEAYERVAAAVRPHGTRLFVQLFHGGREQIASAPRAPALAPSAVPSARFGVEPRALRPDEIDELVDGYARAAALAEAGGLDGIELSAAHRYLIEQFATPTLNRRTDRWREGERFLLEVVEVVRRAAPGLVLGVRLSADSEVASMLARSLVPAGVDYLSIALGESSSYLGSTRIVPPPPEAENTIAAAAKRFDLGLPLIATSRIVDPVTADGLIASGLVAAVGMTRALIADPELPVKAFSGRLDEIVRCIGCNACIAHYHAGTPIACTVNPRTGRERRLPGPSPASARQRLVVVGAGPAGLAAAVEAGRAGHDVVVLERMGRFGGQMALAATAPGASGIATELLDHFDRALGRGAIELRRKTEAAADGVAALQPDGVVVATGARPFVPELELVGIRVTQAWDVLAGAIPEGAAAVVADWGGDPAGLDAAEVLRAAGKAVTLAVQTVAVGQSVHQYRRNLYLQRLYRAGVRIEHHLELLGARSGVAVFRNVFARELETSLEADVLVLALGRTPAAELFPLVAALGLRVEEAGDCRSPRSLEEAILEGTLAARSVLDTRGQIPGRGSVPA
jgi:2,4-dienoyl-CoA reductase-like NADH-dependent reductase (Old Yellow Enzyme family)/thioredoxin reductase